MARRVFFSFHNQDVIDFRANVVRKHWMMKPDREEAGFFDASIWENAKKHGDSSVKKLVNDGLDNTSVTCVLIGSQTYARRWVRYELLKSFKRGNKILGVHINSIKGKDSQVKLSGPNPLEYVGAGFSEDGARVTLWEWTDGHWTQYSELDGGAPYAVNPVRLEYRGKAFDLAKWYRIYDWVRDDGFNNFANWVN